MSDTRFDGALLRARRQELGLTVEELADLTDLTGRPKRRVATLEDFEAGRIRPSVAALEKLCRALDCSPSALYSGGEDDDRDDRPTDLGEATDRWIAETLASAPPMTDRQAARISAILFDAPPP
jgi:transcriptional regulator with XRE-family HTH domain